jgi:type IV pilus assembly protein PilM
LSGSTGIGHGIYKSDLVRRAVRWMDAMAHPPLAIEIGLDRLAGVRWTRQGRIDDLVVEALPSGSIVPSAVETNVVDIEAVRNVLTKVCSRLHAHDEDVTLLLPDPVIRVFVQHFEEFPRSPQQALPMLRWKLKKSVPFAADEMLISYMRQATRENGVDVVTALARQRIVREYDALTESVRLRAGVVLTSSLAAVALLEGEKPTLMARISDTALTTAIVRDGVLCGYRCTELPEHGANLTPTMLLDEIYPVAAYYHDIWHEGIQSVSVAGLGSRLPEFVGPLEAEFHCKVQSLLLSALSDGLIPEFARPLVDHEIGRAHV